MPGIGLPTNCGWYLPGHCVHWIQARKGWEDTEYKPESGRLVDLRDDGTVIVRIGSEIRALWNHQAARIGDVVTLGARVYHQPRWGLLSTSPGGMGGLFCVAASSADHVACPPNPRVGSPAELLRTAGAFSVRGSDLVVR
ncbi:MAG: hypothetical protein KGJ36_01855 [Acidobacteriota bacterium]|nr:hypothetical protein [Acidobacteriota bacterium]